MSSLFGKNLADLVESADRKFQHLKALLSLDEPELCLENLLEPQQSPVLTATPLLTLTLNVDGEVRLVETPSSVAVSASSSSDAAPQQQTVSVKQEEQQQQDVLEAHGEQDDTPTSLTVPLKWSQVRYIDVGKLDIRSCPTPHQKDMSSKGATSARIKKKFRHLSSAKVVKQLLGLAVATRVLEQVVIAIGMLY